MGDKIKKYLAYNGKISVTCINSTKLVDKARDIHDLSPVVTAAFGRALSITAIIANNMKSEDNKLTIQIKGNGPIGMMVITANNYPKLKGYVVNPHVDLPLNKNGKLDVGKAVGKNGYLNIIKDLNLKEPYIGISPLVSGEIAEDFAEYFAKSEQKNTVVSLGVLVDKNGVRSAGGYIVTALPDATEEEISKIEKAIYDADPISKMLDNNLSLDDIAKVITNDNNIQIIEDNIVPIYECDCSKEKIEKLLITLSSQEREDLIKDKKIEIKCHFCNKKYEFNKEELKKLWNMKK